MLLQDLFARGAAPAEAGEFTARAYFNGRLDLTAAEGVAADDRGGQRGGAVAPPASSWRANWPAGSGRQWTPWPRRWPWWKWGSISPTRTSRSSRPTRWARRVGSAEAACASLLADSSRFERLAHEPHLVLVGPAQRRQEYAAQRLGRSGDGPSPRPPPAPPATRCPPRSSSAAAPSASPTWRGWRTPTPKPRGASCPCRPGTPPADPPWPGSSDRCASVPCGPWSRPTGSVLVHDAGDPRPPAAPAPAGGSRHPLKGRPARRPAAARCRNGHCTVSAAHRRELDVLRQALDDLAFGSLSAGPTLALNARHLLSIDKALEALARAARLARRRAELLAPGTARGAGRPRASPRAGLARRPAGADLLLLLHREVACNGRPGGNSGTPPPTSPDTTDAATDLVSAAGNRLDTLTLPP